MNKVLLIGRITKDPQIRATTTGVSTLSFNLAVDRGYKDAAGNSQTDFIPCVAWRNQAEFISMYIKKGYLMAVEGQIQTRTYVDEFNKTVYVTEVVLDRVENLQPRENKQQEVNAPLSNDLPF